MVVPAGPCSPCLELCEVTLGETGPWTGDCRRGWVLWLRREDTQRLCRADKDTEKGRGGRTCSATLDSRSLCGQLPAVSLDVVATGPLHGSRRCPREALKEQHGVFFGYGLWRAGLPAQDWGQDCPQLPREDTHC